VSVTRVRAGFNGFRAPRTAVSLETSPDEESVARCSLWAAARKRTSDPIHE